MNNGICLRCLTRQTYQSGRSLSRASYSSTSHGSPPFGLHSSHPRLGLARRQPPQQSRLPYSRRHSHATATDGSISNSKHAHLTHRRVLAVHGQDAAHFLQGLTTNTVPTNKTGSGFYSSFLNAQGRLLYDVFIYPATTWHHYRARLLLKKLKDAKALDEPGFLIEADADGIQGLVRHLKRYKLRAKVDVWLPEEGELGVFGELGRSAQSEEGTADALRCPDDRAPGFGSRVLIPGHDSTPPTLSLPQYHRARHLAGIPEGQVSTGGEIPHAASLPHETNIDLMGGVDFRKGCYVGQELTIRTQHKGVVRKRILPVSLHSTSTQDGLVEKVQDWITSGASVDILPKGRRGRPAGRWVAGVPATETGRVGDTQGEVGLAMCRLEMMTDLMVEAGGDGGGVRYQDGDEFVLRPKWEDGRKGGDDVEIGVKAQVPGWIREGIEARTKRGGNDRAVDSSGFKEEAVTEG